MSADDELAEKLAGLHEVAMLDHSTRTVHRPAVGEGMHLHTVCGLALHDATIGPHQIVERVLRSVHCADCYPESAA